MPTSLPYHFYATTAFNWAVAPTRLGAIRKALKEASKIATSTETGGIYVWSCRVDLPQTAHYRIESYKPVDVPIADSMDGDFKVKGKSVLRIEAIKEDAPGEWSGGQCDVDPDNCWIDDVTGEHVNAWTGERTSQHSHKSAECGK